MLWKTDNQATEVARRAFPEHAPRVLSNGKRQYVLEPTPYGRVELVGLDRGFMVAAEEPPGGARISTEALPPRLVKHLETHGLHAWKVVQSDDYSEVIRGLAHDEPNEEGELAVPEREMIPFVATVDASAELLGETRQERCEQVAGLADSQRFPGPLVQLVGPDGVGKRTMAAAVARQMGWSLLGELPLSRVFVNRVLQTPPETALDTVLTAGASLAPDQLLLVSDAEMLGLVDDHTSESLLREFARLPHVILLARGETIRTNNLVTLRCPGLESVDDVRTMLRIEHPEVFFAGAALDLAMRASAARAVGLIPGRLLYLVRLAKALRPGDVSDPLRAADLDGIPDAESPSESATKSQGGANEVVLAPDEMSSAVALASGLWADDDEPGDER